MNDHYLFSTGLLLNIGNISYVFPLLLWCGRNGLHQGMIGINKMQ